MKYFLAIFLFISFALQAKTISLSDDNTISIIGSITSKLLVPVTMRIIILNQLKTNSPIYLYLNSLGGDLETSENLIVLLQKSRRPIHIVAVKAASCAFNMAQALGRRYITSHSLLLTHNAYFVTFPITDQSIKEVTEAVTTVMKVYERTAKRLHLSVKEYLKFMEPETWIRGRDNLTINAADEIVTIACSSKLILSGGCSGE